MRDEKLAKIHSERDQAVRQDQMRLKGIADMLVDRHPPGRTQAPSPEVAARSTLIAAHLPHTLPENTIADVLEEVAVATDPNRSGPERAEARLTLEWGYLSILQRRAVYPEKFAEPFVTVYRDALELVQAVLDSGHANRLAKETRDEFLNSFQGVGNIVRENRGWDDTLCETAGPFFDWS